jgi:riboflavin synthase
MFSGLVQGVGVIDSLSPRNEGSADMRMWIALGSLPEGTIDLGESICVRGCCLTVVALDGRRAAFDLSPETLRVTAGFAVGNAVNLERSLTLADRLGGHLVTGHIDGIGDIATIDDLGGSWHVQINAPTTLARYIARKGSICVDGVSLTVNDVDGARFSLNIIPHTLAVTTLQSWRAGMPVNLEIDLIARYCERILSYQAGMPNSQS